MRTRLSGVADRRLPRRLSEMFRCLLQAKRRHTHPYFSRFIAQIKWLLLDQWRVLKDACWLDALQAKPTSITFSAPSAFFVVAFLLIPLREKLRKTRNHAESEGVKAFFLRDCGESARRCLTTYKTKIIMHSGRMAALRDHRPLLILFSVRMNAVCKRCEFRREQLPDRLNDR